MIGFCEQTFVRSKTSSFRSTPRFCLQKYCAETEENDRLSYLDTVTGKYAIESLNYKMLGNDSFSKRVYDL